jgi:hypothetical protein
LKAPGFNPPRVYEVKKNRFQSLISNSTWRHCSEVLAVASAKHEAGEMYSCTSRIHLTVDP